MRLPELAEIDAMPGEDVKACLVQVAALQIRLAVRLMDIHTATPARPVEQVHDRDTVWLDVRAAARVLHRSVSWVQKHGRTLPGFRQLAGPGSPIEFDADALRRYAVMGVAS